MMNFSDIREYLQADARLMEEHGERTYIPRLIDHIYQLDEERKKFKRTLQDVLTICEDQVVNDRIKKALK